MRRKENAGLDFPHVHPGVTVGVFVEFHVERRDEAQRHDNSGVAVGDERYGVVNATQDDAPVHGGG
jgi:hypothetical protein